MDPFTVHDHLAANIACDYNHDTSGELDIVLNKGRNTHFRRCLYGKSMHEIQIEYLMQFWDAYSDNRKIFRTRFLENHEATGELVKYNDEDLYNFFQEFEAKGYLKDTIVYFISDHGQHFIVGHLPALPDNSRLEENFLPLIIMLVPSDIPKENIKFLESNQQHFMTGIDIYSSMKSIAVGGNANSSYFKSYSLLYETLPSDRNCDVNKGDINFSDCWCNKEFTTTENKIAKRGIFYVEF